MKIKLCLIGLGNFGKKIYEKVGFLSSGEIVSCFHPSGEKARAFHLQKGTSDFQAALREVNGVIIATPNDLHAKYIQECISAGKHIFVEKPLCESYATALSLKEMVEKSNLIVAVGHNQRKEACFREAKKIIASGKLGKLVNITMNYSHGGAFSFHQGEWRWRASRHKEGPLITNGVHLIDTLHYLFGPISSVYATINNISRQTEAPDCNAVVLNLACGATVFLQTNYNIPSENICSIHGTEGTIYITRGELSLRLGRDREEQGRYIASIPSAISLLPVDSIAEGIDQFCKTIVGQGTVEVKFKEGLKALAIIEACNKSNAEQRVVNMAEFPDYMHEEPADGPKNISKEQTGKTWLSGKDL